MSLAFYMDEHVPRSITAGLRLRNIDVLTVQEDGRTGFPDPQVLDRATELCESIGERSEPRLLGEVGVLR
jgi:Domain of unknown function (DUF5615)